MSHVEMAVDLQQDAALVQGLLSACNERLKALADPKKPWLSLCLTKVSIYDGCSIVACLNSTKGTANVEVMTFSCHKASDALYAALCWICADGKVEMSTLLPRFKAREGFWDEALGKLAYVERLREQVAAKLQSIRRGKKGDRR